MKAAIFSLTCLSLAASASADRPNILLVVADDQRPDTIAALHGAHLRTPNLDRLAARGTVFTRAYAGYPICHVSRAEILTGCSAFRAYRNYPNGPIDPALKTLAATFREAGYLTWYSGKWHNDGLPLQRGYTGIRGLYSSGGGGPKLMAPQTDERGNPITGYTGWTFKDDAGRPELEKGTGLRPDNSLHIADGAIRALRETPADQPFLLHVNFAFPHDPRVWPLDPAHHHEPDRTPLPPNFGPQHPFDHGNEGGRDEMLLPVPRTEGAVQLELAVYHSMITDLDSQLGRILAVLEDSGRASNTLIVFTSDQGLAIGSHGLLGKQNQYEHSIRSPLIMVGAGVPAGRQSRALVMLQDLFPTFCDLANVTVPDTVRGHSLVPLLSGQLERVRERVFGVFTDTQRMVCDERWKLIEYPQIRRRQLFDLENDPYELRDISAEAAHSETAAMLMKHLNEWRKSEGDPLMP